MQVDSGTSLLQVRGTIGAKAATATLHSGGVDLRIGHNAVQSITQLWLIGLQRVSPHLKTCDVVWLDGATHTATVQTIAQQEVEKIVNHAPCKVYVLGLDPPRWSTLTATARKHKWQSEDWQHVFSEQATEDSEDSSEEWLPGSASSESEDDDSDDDRH
jgi:hypothetical protein